MISLNIDCIGLYNPSSKFKCTILTGFGTVMTVNIPPERIDVQHSEILGPLRAVRISGIITEKQFEAIRPYLENCLISYFGAMMLKPPGQTAPFLEPEQLKEKAQQAEVVEVYDANGKVKKKVKGED